MNCQRSVRYLYPMNKDLFKPSPGNGIFTPLAFLLLCCMVLYGTGCSRVLSIQSTESAVEIKNTYNEEYLLGIKAYFVQDYRAATENFLSVVEFTTDPVLARKALFSLACTQMMLADTEDKFRTAMTYWEAWLQAAPRNWEFENPILFDPIVNNRFFAGFRGRDTLQEQVAKSAPSTSNWSEFDLQTELDRMKLELEAARQQADERQDTIRVLKQENAKLKEQIRALELIDQKIQEKKTAIPATE